ncbi:MAG: PilZ domain-containing protein [Candidatus Cloacimonetes bacterium]|nr:PilZ domain-containing protein [Candidatus Cloacimonadota bacterium]
MRRFIRHPASIPIIYSLEDRMDPHEELASNIGHGGLCFRSEHPLPTGSVIQIQIMVHEPAFEANGTVMWSKKRNDHYEIGIEFDNADIEFRVRMVEQVCYIEHYRHEVEREEGRKLSSREAALEWIRKFGGSFPHIE